MQFMSMAEVCSIGQLLQDQCHRVLHTRAVGFKNKADLSDNEIQLLSLRTCQDCENIVNICLHHEQVLLRRFDQLLQPIWSTWCKDCKILEGCHNRKVT